MPRLDLDDFETFDGRLLGPGSKSGNEEKEGGKDENDGADITSSYHPRNCVFTRLNRSIGTYRWYGKRKRDYSGDTHASCVTFVPIF